MNEEEKQHFLMQFGRGGEGPVPNNNSRSGDFPPPHLPPHIPLACTCRATHFFPILHLSLLTFPHPKNNHLESREQTFYLSLLSFLKISQTSQADDTTNFDHVIRIISSICSLPISQESGVFPTIPHASPLQQRSGSISHITQIS